MSSELTYNEAVKQLKKKIEENSKKTKPYIEYIDKLEKYNSYLKEQKKYINIIKQFVGVNGVKMPKKVDKPEIVQKPDCTLLTERTISVSSEGWKEYTVSHYDDDTMELTKFTKENEYPSNVYNFLIPKMYDRKEINFDLGTFEDLKKEQSQNKERKEEKIPEKIPVKTPEKPKEEKDEIKEIIKKKKKRIVVIENLYNGYDLILDIDTKDIDKDGDFRPVFNIKGEEVSSIGDVIKYGNTNTETGGKRTRRNRKARKSKKSRKSRR